MKLRRFHLLCLAGAFLFCPANTILQAQTAGTGALAGVVTDASGAVVPNVTVIARSADTGQERTATTATDGSYRFALLPPGNYSVKFAASGFKTVEVPSVLINVTETPVLNRSLEVGTQTEQITVSETTETVQTATSTIGTVIGSTGVAGLPLSTRNYTTILPFPPASAPA